MHCADDQVIGSTILVVLAIAIDELENSTCVLGIGSRIRKQQESILVPRLLLQDAHRFRSSILWLVNGRVQKSEFEPRVEVVGVEFYSLSKIRERGEVFSLELINDPQPRDRNWLQGRQLEDGQVFNFGPIILFGLEITIGLGEIPIYSGLFGATRTRDGDEAYHQHSKAGKAKCFCAAQRRGQNVPLAPRRAQIAAKKESSNFDQPG